MKQPKREQFDRKQMPFILKLLTVLCFAGVLFPVGAAIPGDGFTINGQQVSQAEFWRLGAGPLFVLVGIVFPITGYAFAQRKSWGRHLFTGFLFVDNIAMLIAGQFVPVYRMRPVDLIQYPIFMALLVWYLFFKQSVREYFDGGNKASNQMPHVP